MKKSDKLKAICDKHVANCKDCPLKEPCAFRYDDDKESFLERMNEAAEFEYTMQELTEEAENLGLYPWSEAKQ